MRNTQENHPDYLTTEGRARIERDLSAMGRHDGKRRFIAKIRYLIHQKQHGLWWKFLWATGLARPYSKAMCRLNLYRRYADGRCQWCGDKHFER
jgi:hypothetical protein